MLNSGSKTKISTKKTGRSHFGKNLSQIKMPEYVLSPFPKMLNIQDDAEMCTLGGGI